MKSILTVFDSVFGGLKTQKDLNTFNAFFSMYGLLEDTNIKMTTEKIKNNIFWLKKNRKDLRKYLSERYP